MKGQFKTVLIVGVVIASLRAGAAPPDRLCWSDFSMTETNADGTCAQLINGVWSNANVEKLKREAEAGNAEAQADLATCLYDGRHTVVTNYVAAYKWAVVAASQKQKRAMHLVKEMDLFLTSRQLEEGKQAAKTVLDEQAAKKH